MTPGSPPATGRGDLSAMAEVAAEAVDRLAITPAQSLHRAIARRAFGAVPLAGMPAKAVHDSVTDALYGGIRLGAAMAGRAGAAVLDRAAARGQVPDLGRTIGGRKIIAVVNGLIGDLLVERNSPLAFAMALRLNGADLPIRNATLRRAFPRPTGKVVVFLHGLAESDDDWRPRQRRWFGARLRRDLGFTPLVVRFNSGLHISENGRLFSELMVRLLSEWPVPVEEIALVGHSMGGLVIRSACLAGEGSRWVSLVRSIVTLGTPHSGAPLEKFVHVAAWTLRRVPEAAPLAEILELRSAGIRDLRFGYLSESEWSAEDPARLYHDGRTAVAPLLPWCRYTLVSATLTGDHHNPAAHLVGDLLVTHASASDLEVGEDSVVHLGGLSHFDLLHDERVYTVLRSALDAPAGLSSLRVVATDSASVAQRQGSAEHRSERVRRRVSEKRRS